MAAPTLKQILGTSASKSSTSPSGSLPTLDEVLGSGGSQLPTLKDVLAGATKPAHRGILGTIGHAFGQGASDLEHAAINAPAGVVQLGVAEYQALKKTVEHPIVSGPSDPNYADKSAITPLIHGMAKSTVQSFEHPLRRPGYTLLNLLPVAGGAARAAELAGLSGGERALTVGGATVHPELARGALGRVVQRATDTRLQRAAAAKPAGVGAALLHRRFGKVVTAEAKQASRNAQGPAARLIQIGRRLSPGEQKALQVVAEQAPLEGRITAAAARVTGARDEAARLRHQEELQLLHEARPHLTVGPDGKPAFAETSTNLPHVYKLMQKVAGGRETLLKSLGQLSDESIQSRTTAAGRVALGAHYVEPTPSRLGVSPALDRQQALVDKLQKRFDTAHAAATGAAEKGAAALEPASASPQAIAGAKVRLARLEAEHTKALDKVAAGMFGPVDKAEVARRNVENARARRQQAGVNRAGRAAGYSGRKSILRPTVKNERRNLAEQAIEDAIAKNPNHPTLARWRQRTAEIDQLRAALTPSEETAFGRVIPAKSRPGMPHYERIAELKAAGVPEERAAALALGETAVSNFQRRVEEATSPQARAEAERKLAGQQRLLDQARAAAISEPVSRAALGKEPVASAVGTRVVGPGSVTAPGPVGRVERLGGALSVAKDRLEQLQQRVARGVEPTGIVGHEDFAAGPGAVRIPDVATKQGTKALSRGAGAVGAQGTIGHLRAPGSTTHGYTGALREEGLRRQDTAQLVGESGLEASKFAGLKHIHDLVRQAAAPTPARADDIAVRLDDLKPSDRTPLEVRKFLSDPGEFFQQATPHEQASMLDRVRQQLFIQPHTLDAQTRAEFERLNAEGKIGWVPKRILGELGNPAAPLRAVAPGKAVGTVDAINNASRFAILYLKPAYAIPNVLGNTALSLVQQGWAAPRNLAQAARLVQKLHPDDYARMDSAMGEGLARAISAHGGGPLSRVVDAAAGKWSTVVDTPFRRASFLHEARVEGFRTPEQIHELLTRDAHDPALIRVGLRANRDAIDYENLSGVEREIVRRVVFFYPWVKGSTVYAGRFLRDHPVKAAGVGQLGEQGQQFSQAGLGPAPSYLEGLIPFGHDRAFNPTSAAILQTPAQVAESVQGILSGRISDAANLSNYFTPALALAIAEYTRQHGGTGVPYKPGTNALGVAEQELFGGLPQVSLAHALTAAATGHGGSKLYPPSIAGALGQFFLGGLYPRRINRARLNDLAYSEQARMQRGR